MKTTYTDNEMFYINFLRAKRGLPPRENNKILWVSVWVETIMTCYAIIVDKTIMHV